MKKSPNPFWGWRGYGTQSQFVYHVTNGAMYYNKTFMGANDVRHVLGDHFEKFKKSPARGDIKRVSSGGKWSVRYSVENVFAFALSLGLAVDDVPPTKQGVAK